MSIEKRFEKAVVLGAGGFIGINLVNELVNRGYQTICFDKAFSDHWPKEVKTVIGDFSSVPEALTKELDNALIFHLVSSARPSDDTIEIPNEIENDLVSTIRLIEKSYQLNSKWVYISSGGTVYGPTTEGTPIPEEHPTKPACSYGITKLSIESYLQLYGRLHGLDYAIARLSNPFGPWQHPLRGQGVIMALLYSLIKNREITIWGDGEIVRDYVYIQDAVEGLICIAEKAEAGALFNLASGEGLSINQLIQIATKELNIKPDIRYLEARPTDVSYNVLNIEKIYKHLEWRPKTAVTVGINKAVQWLKEL